MLKKLLEVNDDTSFKKEKKCSTSLYWARELGLVLSSLVDFSQTEPNRAFFDSS